MNRPLVSGFPANVTTGKAGTDRYLRLESANNISSLEVILQAVYVMDDYVHVDPFAYSSQRLEFPITDVTINMLTSLDICDPNPGHWESFIFDPTLSGLFNGAIDDPTAPLGSPANPSKKGLSGPQKAAIGVTVSIILALGIFVIIAFTVPQVKIFLRPATASASLSQTNTRSPSTQTH